MDAKVFTVIGSTKDPADIGGMLKPDGTLIPPGWAKEIRSRSLRGERSVLFLDEFSSMAPLVHAALLRVVRDKVAGECELDPRYKTRGRLKRGWIGERGEPTRYGGHAVHVVCAANPRSEGAAAIDLPPPAANRMLHIQWPPPDPISWAAGLVGGFPLPKLDVLPDNWRRRPEVKWAKKDVAAFLAHRTKTLEFPDRREARGGAWPSPRSWEMAAEALGAARIVNAPRIVEIKLLEGCVGYDARVAFFNWLQASKEWSESIAPQATRALDVDPKALDEVSDYSNLDHLYVLGQHLVDQVGANPSKKHWEDAWRVIEHIVAQSQVTGKEFSTAPLNVMAADLLAMLDDPKQFDKLRGVKLPSDELLAALDFEGIKVRPSRSRRKA
jgi:hypothetical protein